MKRINLITRQKKYIDFERFFNRFRLVFFLLTLFFIFVYILSFVILSEKKSQIDNLLAQKKELLDYLMQHRQVEAKYLYFRDKEKQLADIIKEDVNFLPYYNVLKESLKASSPEAFLESVEIDKNKSVNFIVGFNDYTAFLNFLKFAESDFFLDNFSQLILSNFASSSVAQNKFQLSFRGVFAKLNED